MDEVGVAGSVDGVAGVCGVGVGVVVVAVASAVETGESLGCDCCCGGCIGGMVAVGLGLYSVSIACTNPSGRRTNLASFDRHHISVGKLMAVVSSGCVVSGLTLQFRRKR